MKYKWITDHGHSGPVLPVDHHPCIAVSGKDMSPRGCLIGEPLWDALHGHCNPDPDLDHGYGRDHDPIPYLCLSFVCKVILKNTAVQMWLIRVRAMWTDIFTWTGLYLELLRSALAAPSLFSSFQYSEMLDSSLKAN